MYIPGIGNVFLAGAGGVSLIGMTRSYRGKKTKKETVGDIPPPPDPDEEAEEKRKKKKPAAKTSGMERRQEREDKRRRRAMKLGPVVVPSSN